MFVSSASVHQPTGGVGHPSASAPLISFAASSRISIHKGSQFFSLPSRKPPSHPQYNLMQDQVSLPHSLHLPAPWRPRVRTPSTQSCFFSGSCLHFFSFTCSRLVTHPHQLQRPPQWKHRQQLEHLHAQRSHPRLEKPSSTTPPQTSLPSKPCERSPSQLKFWSGSLPATSLSSASAMTALCGAHWTTAGAPSSSKKTRNGSRASHRGSRRWRRTTWVMTPRWARPTSCWSQGSRQAAWCWKTPSFPSARWRWPSCRMCSMRWTGTWSWWMHPPATSHRRPGGWAQSTRRAWQLEGGGGRGIPMFLCMMWIERWRISSQRPSCVRFTWKKRREG